MVALLIALVALGLLDSLNPATILTGILLLATVRPMPRFWAFTFGTVVTYLALGVLLYFGLGFLGPQSPVFAWFRVGLGVAFLGIALYFSFRPMPSLSVTLGRINPLALVGLAVTSTLSDFPTAFPYLAFLERLSSANLADGLALLLLLGYNLLYILPLLLLVVFYAATRSHLEGLQQRFELFFTRYGRVLTVGFMYPVALWFLYEGAKGLGWL